MATDKEIDQIERRADLAAKVAMLEERSLHNQEHLTKIEVVLLTHSSDEEKMLLDINNTLIELKSNFDKKLLEELEPIKKDISDFKLIMKLLAGSASIIGSGLALFWEQIVNLILH